MRTICILKNGNKESKIQKTEFGFYVLNLFNSFNNSQVSRVFIWKWYKTMKWAEKYANTFLQS